jgi:hypothetical protein
MKTITACVIIVLAILFMHLLTVRNKELMSVDYCFRDNGGHYICNDTGEYD